MSTESVTDLADWLRRRPDDDLGALLRERPDLLHPAPSDMSVLASRANSRASAELAIDRLDLASIQVLEALALLPDPTTVADLAALLSVKPDRLDASMSRLRATALVFGPDDELRLAHVVRELLPYPANLGPPARFALTEVAPAQLPTMLADVRALLGDDVTRPPLPPLPPLSPVEALDALAQIFEDREQLARVLDAVPAKPREVVDLLAEGTPVGRTTGARRLVDAKSADSPVRWLLAHGLLVAVDDYTVVLPREISLLARGDRVFPELLLELPLFEAASYPPSDVDAVAAGEAFTTVRLVESFLERWGIDPPGVLRAGGVGVRELRRTARELEIDERRAALLIEVAHAAGLVAPDDTGESWLPTAGPTGYDAWLAQPTAIRWALLGRAWLNTTRMPALVGRRPEPYETATGSRPAHAPNALGPEVDRALAPIVRRALLNLLRDIEPGAAPSRDDLVAALRFWSPRRGGWLRDDLAISTHEEAELLGVTGRGALSSFGRALLCPDDDESNPVGAVDTVDPVDAADPVDPVDAAARVLEPLLPQPLDHVLLQADLTAIAPGPLETELARELSLLADVESTGGATVYRFSAASVRRALDAGRSAAELQELLARRSKTPVPQPLSYLVADVARRHGRIRVGAAGCYVRCDDESVLAEALADRRLDSLRLSRLAPSVLVSPLGAERVVERLREVGYAPAAEAAGGGLLLRRPDSRRAPARFRPTRQRVELAVPSATLVSSAIRVIRAGDKTSAAMRAKFANTSAPGGPGGPMPRTTAAESLAALREAVATRRELWIGYLNAQGQASTRIIEPLRLAGGQVIAFDHQRSEMRTFAVHRITGVAWADEVPDDALDEMPDDAPGDMPGDALG